LEGVRNKLIGENTYVDLTERRSNGKLRKLYNEKLYSLYFSTNEISEDEVGRAFGMHGTEEKFIQNFS
jgi:hypothetical protein